MSNKMEFEFYNEQCYSKEQIINEFVRKFPRSKLAHVVKFIKSYEQNQIKYVKTGTAIGEIIIDCVKNVNIN